MNYDDIQMLFATPVDMYSTDVVERARFQTASQTCTLLDLHSNASVMQVELRYEAQVSRQNQSSVSPLALESAVRLRTLTLDDFPTTLPHACPQPSLLMASSRSCSNSSEDSKDLLPSASFLLQVDDDNGRTLTATSLLPRRQVLIPSDDAAAQGGLKSRHTLCKRRSQGWLLSKAFPQKGTAPMHARDGVHPTNVPGIDADVLRQWFRSDVAALLHSALDDASLSAAMQLSAARMRLLGTFVQGLALNFTYDHGEPADDVRTDHLSAPCIVRF
jgi:hypothetical protein